MSAQARIGVIAHICAFIQKPAAFVPERALSTNAGVNFANMQRPIRNSLRMHHVVCQRLYGIKTESLNQSSTVSVYRGCAVFFTMEPTGYHIVCEQCYDTFSFERVIY